MSETDDLAGIIGEIEADNASHDPVEQTEEVNTTATAEGSESTTETETNTKTQNQNTEEVESQETGTTEEGTTETDATTTETDAHSKTETQTDADVDNWKAQLPPPPTPYQGPVPELDPETGQITNMSAQEYATYMRESTKAELRSELYTQMVETQSFNVAEQILPELKTNPSVRKLVEDARVASIINGQQIDTVEAAKLVREALGLAPAKIADARAQGAQNAKASIEVQKNASLETSSSQKADSTSDKVTTLQKRIQRGDDEAFVELLNVWEEKGILK